MPFSRFKNTDNVALLWTLAKWGGLGAMVGALSGIASAVFLHALDWATNTRESHAWLLFLLPLAGLVIGWAYDKFGRAVAAGNNLLLESIHSEQGNAIPFRMIPLVLLGTVATHLFGGSAGREGTAVQMGGTLASLLARPLKLPARDHRLLVMSGISGGFGSVFGTPLAGAIFGMEVLSLGTVRYDALFPCLVASLVGDAVCRALGVHHHAYQIGVSLPAQTPLLWGLIVLASGLFAGAAAAFAELTHAIGQLMKDRFASPLLRPVIGGLVIIALTYLVGTRDYLGLSLPLIERSFTPEGVVLGAFALKILFTSITLGAGFKGGEVTPLFCIGATLGAAFAQVTGQPTAFFAALGFVAVFAGAANTPLACAIMGIELFGNRMAVPLFVSCVIAYILSGHRGIYLSQRIGISKAHGIVIPDGSRLSDRHRRPVVPPAESATAAERSSA